MRIFIILAFLAFVGALVYTDPELSAVAEKLYLKAEAAYYEDGGKVKPKVVRKAKHYQTQKNPKIVLTADRSGHFTARVLVNGTHIEFLVDTGASIVFLSRDDARRIGFNINKLVYNREALTASGTTKFAPVKLDSISIGGIVVRDVEAAIASSDQVSSNLLGMTFLKRIKGFEFSGNRLTMRN